jgi:hypothetical protein
VPALATTGSSSSATAREVRGPRDASSTSCSPTPTARRSNLPDPRKDDDEGAAMKPKALCRRQKDLKKLVEQQSTQLYEGMYTERRCLWRDWKTYLMAPIVKFLCQRLIWCVREETSCWRRSARWTTARSAARRTKRSPSRRRHDPAGHRSFAGGSRCGLGAAPERLRGRRCLGRSAAAAFAPTAEQSRPRRWPSTTGT